MNPTKRTPRTITLHVRVTPDEHEAIVAAARAAQRTISDWIRIAASNYGEAIYTRLHESGESK